MRPPHRTLLVALLPALVACSSVGSFVWVHDLPKEPVALPSEYVIRSGDLLAVRVLGHDDLSNAKARVREDGRIVMPIVGELNPRGMRPSAFRAEVEARLKDYVKEPTVSVDIEETAPATVSVLGEVVRPGVIRIEAGEGMARALAEAGGLTRFASRDRIFVLRGGEHAVRIRFTYDALTRGEQPAAVFALHAGDVVVVE